MDTRTPSAGKADSTGVAALLHATDAHGRVDPLAYEAQRLILRNQTLGGIDAGRMVEDMVASPAFRDRDGEPQFKPLIDAIGVRLSEHEKGRFNDALDAANVTDGRMERLGEQATDLARRMAAELHGRISDGMADAQRRMHDLAADTDHGQAQRAAAIAASQAIGKVQFGYGASGGAATHAVDTAEDLVALAAATKRFATDAHYRDLVVGTAKMYAAEVAEDPRKPLDDARAWAREAIDRWQAGLDQASREGREAEYLGSDAGKVGIEVVATLVPAAKLGRLAHAFDRFTPDNAHVVTGLLDDVGQARAKGGLAAEGSDLALRGAMGMARERGQLLPLVEAGRATGNLDAMLRIGEFKPDELAFLQKHDPAIFAGKVPFDEALAASTRGIDPVALSATAAGRKQLGDIGEAIMTRDLVKAGYTDIVSLQNKSGHGIDLIGRNPAGELEFFEVKTSARGMAREQYGNPDQFIERRLTLAIAGVGQWAHHRVPEGMRALAERLRDEIAEQGGQVNAKWVRLNLSREPGSPDLRIDKAVDVWQAPSLGARGAFIDESRPRLPSDNGLLGDAYLDRAHAAALAGDSKALDQIAREFTQSAEGQRMIQQGNELFAQQQLELQQQAEHRSRQEEPPPVRTLVPLPPTA